MTVLHRRLRAAAKQYEKGFKEAGLEMILPLLLPSKVHPGILFSLFLSLIARIFKKLYCETPILKVKSGECRAQRIT
jgi:hypothetical protein